jgi:hypothetical protein
MPVLAPLGTAARYTPAHTTHRKKKEEEKEKKVNQTDALSKKSHFSLLSPKLSCLSLSHTTTHTEGGGDFDFHCGVAAAVEDLPPVDGSDHRIGTALQLLGLGEIGSTDKERRERGREISKRKKA